jgi:hypothetical protein
MFQNLLVSKSNHYGLDRDATLLAEAIRDAGFNAESSPLSGRPLRDRITRRRIAERIIHIERAFPKWFSAGRENVLVPNQERFPKRQLGRLKGIDRVLAKSRHAAGIFANLGVSTSYLGFTSPDRRQSGIAKAWKRCFHLAGGSTLKGTEEVLSLWSRHPEWPQLVLVQKARNAPAHLPRNVLSIPGYLEDDELRKLQNACGIHLCPSRSEGWGHHIVEAMSCGALILTTDAPPMNEHVSEECGLMVACARSEPRHLGTNHYVDPDALEAAVERALTMTDEDQRRLGDAAQRRYVAIDTGFRQRVAELLAPVTAVDDRKR